MMMLFLAVVRRGRRSSELLSPVAEGDDGITEGEDGNAAGDEGTEGTADVEGDEAAAVELLARRGITTSTMSPRGRGPDFRGIVFLAVVAFAWAFFAAASA